MKYRDYFTDYDEDGVIRFEKYLIRLSPEQVDSLYDYLIDVSIDANPKIKDTILDGRVEVTGSNSVEYSGSGEYSSEESNTYLVIYVDNVLIGELVYSIGTAFASESQVLSLEFIEEEIALAKLSERVDNTDERWVAPLKERTNETRDVYIEGGSIPSGKMYKELTLQESKTMAQFNTTNSLRTLNLTLIDLSSELKGEKKVVYEQANVRTEYNDEQTIQNLLATGDVLSALQLHNEKVRTKTLDAQYKGSAREVFLEEIDHLGDSRLKWEVIRVG